MGRPVGLPWLAMSRFVGVQRLGMSRIVGEQRLVKERIVGSIRREQLVVGMVAMVRPDTGSRPVSVWPAGDESRIVGKQWLVKERIVGSVWDAMGWVVVMA